MGKMAKKQTALMECKKMRGILALAFTISESRPGCLDPSMQAIKKH